MMDIGFKIKLMDMELTHILTVLNMKGNGTRISSMVRVWSNGLMVQSLKVVMKKERKMEQESISGQMERDMRANGLTMKQLDMVFINGQMVESMWAIGNLILWIALDYILGRTVECMRAIIKKIKNMVMVSISGLILSNTQVGGIMASNMVWVFSFQKTARRNMVYGKTAKSLDGLVVKRLLKQKINNYL